MKRQWINYIVLLVFIPIVIWFGVTFLEDRRYVFISLVIVLITMFPIFQSLEMRTMNVRLLVILAVMTALSVVGRMLFAALPGFKPVTAIIILTAIYFGGEAGFIVGALSALISNIYFGQGPWTPFQMFSWGMVGLLAGLPWVRKRLKHSYFALILFGIISGVLFSILMDIWTVLSLDGTFNWRRYVAVVGLSMPFMATYALSNVIFLLLTMKPIGQKLERIKTKYNVGGLTNEQSS